MTRSQNDQIHMLEMKGWKADDFYGDVETQPHEKNAFVLGVCLFHCLVSCDSVLAARSLPTLSHVLGGTPYLSLSLPKPRFSAAQ